MSSDKMTRPSASSMPSPVSGPLYLGLDGGGTKTLALLGYKLDGHLEIVGAGQGGASNPRAVGFDLAFQSIDHAIAESFKAANLNRSCAEKITLCLAGAGRPEEKSTVESWIVESQIARQARVVSEAEAVLEASLPAFLSEHSSNAPAEVALICGTGSLAWGRRGNDRSDDPSRFARSGGWGYLLGDEGSGFWIGQKLLQAACHAADGRSSETDLLKAVLQHLALDSPSQIIGWCYQDAASRQRIAALAPFAFQLADRSNGSASNSDVPSETITQASKDLAAMIRSVVHQLDATSYRLSVAGSVVIHQPHFLQQVVDLLGRGGLRPLHVALVDQPALGCLLLATV
ncbi:MAG: BadF/BadG/BcrA/BcrD ATPase family protein [Pirellulales bacterium]